jgi:polyribonucleotide nucleotidyltransferase
MEKRIFEYILNGKKLIFETGELAKQATSSVLVRYADSVILVAVTASNEAKDIDFFPLTVNYEERLYAVGKIPGGFIKREGRPSEKATLASRLVDRPIRPLFPEGFRNEVQVSATVLSVDQDASTEIAALLGTSLALSISDIPFSEPIAGVEVGYVDNKLIINPNVEEAEKSQISLTVAGTKNGINMVEAGANMVSEELMLEAILFGHEEIKRLVAFQEKIVAEIGKAKREVTLYSIDADIKNSVTEYAKARLVDAIQIKDKQERATAVEAINVDTINYFAEQYAEKIGQVKESLEEILRDEVRRLILEEKVRPDGRKLDEIRPISTAVGILPRPHGSGLFTRGQTQALSICTLGVLADMQKLDGLDLEETKRFMHHYNFPPYSVGEARPARAPGRREIGHGALGEKALDPIIPSEDDFPYTIRVVSEVLESNGSSSQASICASTLALMQAGVPIKAPVAGIAMGLVKEADKTAVLTDIQGLEDHLGDMDFKVAGTADGITALQMDIKIDDINRSILETALEQAKQGRLFILNKMAETITAPNRELSEYAPKIITIRIDPDKIRDVIGPSGRIINQIIDETGVKIDIEQDGRVYIASQDLAQNEKAKLIIEGLVREPIVGETYLGTVKRIEKFGAFVEIFSGKEGLVHISQLDNKRVENVEDIVNIGDSIMVKLTEIDNQGRLNLSRKAALKDNQTEDQDKK